MITSGGWNLAYGEFWPKNSYFTTLKLCTKKNTTEKLKISVETTLGFKKTDFWFVETTFGFKIIWLFSKSALIIVFWKVKIARFENENEDVFQIEIRLRIENVTYLAIYRVLRVNFYKNDVVLKQQKGPKLDEMTDFCVFQKQHSREAKN